MIKITDNGAQVVSWMPAHCNQDVLWVSNKAIFDEGHSVRGGIPICWPWFGQKEGLPQHGFIRKMKWHHEKREIVKDNFEINVYRISDNATTFALWPHHFELELEIISGDNLELKLTTRNTGNSPFEITQALHTYFLVGNIDEIWIEGLENKTYLDKTDDFKVKIQHGELRINGVTDRIYNTELPTKIIDPIFKRIISIQNFNSKTTVVWNPWDKASEQIGDMGENEFKQMLCVETANANNDPIIIEPQSSFTLSTIIKVTNL